jgi:uncharacterized membrane protein YfcA
MTVPAADGRDQADPENAESHERSPVRDGAVCLILGAAIGAAAGLIGVGGGEFRIPVLLHILRLPVKVAAGANTVIGLFVVVLSVARRWGQQRWTADDLALGAVMAVASIAGATIGARRAHQLSTPLLKPELYPHLIIDRSTHSN